jgi:hypothetical protein
MSTVAPSEPQALTRSANAEAIESGLFTVLKPTLEAVDANIKSVFDSQAFLDAQLSKLEKGT